MRTEELECCISKEYLQSILQHTWPGNIRELVNVLERIYILSQGRKYAKSKSLFATNNDGNQQQLELQVENKTEHPLNFREKYSVIA